MSPDTGRAASLGVSKLEDSRLMDVERAGIAVGGHPLYGGPDQLYSAEAFKANLDPSFGYWGDAIKVITAGNGIQWRLVEQGFKDQLEAGLIEEMPSPMEITKKTQELAGEALKGAFGERNPVADYTKVLVDPNDMEPRKGTGEWVEGRESFDQRGVPCLEHPEKKGHFREAVPSPRVLDVINVPHIMNLLKTRLLFACGGGGIPVVQDGELWSFDYYPVNGGGFEETKRRYKFVEGRVIVDKDDATSALLDRIGMQLMVVLTGADGCYENFEDPARRRLVPSMTPHGAAQFLDQHVKSSGDMRPKLASVARFVEGDPARLGLITSAESLARGDLSQMTVIENRLMAA